MMNYFTSDFHLGHKNILKYRPEFKSIEEHDNIIFDEISKLKKRDILFILGDFIFDSNNYNYYINILNKMSCRFKILLGNHDSLKILNESKFEIQLPMYSYKNFWLTHCPIYENEIRGRKGNIHGHLHKQIIDNPYYLNVNIDVNKYKFLNFDEIIDIFKWRKI